ncbi:hypothetical protein OIO90_000227 [Microbotryomycetes sp. JL221]|nr:hypothetical protein OIO90_000227 [Microbotryomycetes sp. JL221]
MAQRYRPPASVVDSRLTLSTSLQEIGTLIKTGVSCLAWVRDLFEEHAFSQQDYVVARASNSSAPASPPSSQGSQSDPRLSLLKTQELTRGRSSEVDKLLDCLEMGVMDALRHGYLDKLDTPQTYQPPKFYDVHPDNVKYYATTPHVESVPDVAVIGHAGSTFHTVSVHTFSVASHLGPTDTSDVLSKEECTRLNVESSAGRKVVWDAEKLVVAVTDDLDKIQEPAVTGLRADDGAIHELQEALHDSHLQRTRVEVGIEPGLGTVIHPRGEREAYLFAPAQSDKEILERVLREQDAVGSQEPTQSHPAVSRKKSLVIRTDSSEARERMAAGEDGGTAVTHEPEMESRFQSQTQIEATLQQPARRKPGRPRGSKRKKHDIAVNTNDVMSTRRTTRHKTTSQSQPPPSASQKSASEVAKIKKRQKTGVTCECGDPDEDGYMVECSVCTKFKHAVCYGFYDASKSKIPDIFTCYGCRFEMSSLDALLEPEKQPKSELVLHDLESLALVRRALAIVLENAEVSMSQLKTWLNVDGRTANMLGERLRSEGFVEDPSDARKKGKGVAQKSRGLAHRLKPGTLIVRDAPGRRKVIQERYFSPDAGAEAEITNVLAMPARESRDQEEPDTVEEDTGPNPHGHSAASIEHDSIEDADHVTNPRDSSIPSVKAQHAALQTTDMTDSTAITSENGQIKKQSRPSKIVHSTSQSPLVPSTPKFANGVMPMDLDGLDSDSMPSLPTLPDAQHDKHPKQVTNGHSRAGLNKRSAPLADRLSENEEPDTEDDQELGVLPSTRVLTEEAAGARKKRKISEAERIEA